MNDEELLTELRSIFDGLVLRDHSSGEKELQGAAVASLAAVARWQLARQTAMTLEHIEKADNQRTH